MDHKKNVLVTDDIESIRFAIKEYLKDTFNIFEAESGGEAIRILEKHEIDFLISDIRMPGMGGLELIQHVRSHFPAVQYALMTAYNVNDYIEFARSKSIWNIIPKSSNLDLNFIKVMIEKNLTKDIFGIEKYFPGILFNLLEYETLLQKDFKMLKNTCWKLTLSDPEKCDQSCDRIGEVMIQSGCPSIIRQVIDELVSNAISHPHSEKKLNTGSVFEIHFGKFNNKFIFSITDFYGLLEREEILFRIERHIKLDDKGLPVGISDSHGRGLFISRENLDHLIFNIEKNKKTEVIGILSEDIISRNKSLSIYQI